MRIFGNAFSTAVLVVILFLVSQNAAWAQKLAIHTQSGDTHYFSVELAETPEEKSKGLMFRKELQPSSGMVFQHDGSYGFAFWMKNTYIPLDMLFIDRSGTIRHIHPNAEPFSEKIITWHGPTWLAVEIAGGEAKKRGIKEGDTAMLMKTIRESKEP